MIYGVGVSAEQILRSDRSWRSLFAGAYSMTAAWIIPRQKVINRLLSYVEKQKTRERRNARASARARARADFESRPGFGIAACGNPSRFLIAATSAAVQRTTRLHLEDSRLAESATAEMNIVVIDVPTGWSILARSGSDSKRMPSRSGARHRAIAGGISSRAVGITEATVKIYSVIITIRRLGGTSDI